VNAAMDVSVILAVIPGDFIDDARGMLSGRRIVQVDEGVPVDSLFKDREISAILLSKQIGRHDQTSTGQPLVATRAIYDSTVTSMFSSSCYFFQLLQCAHN
jgi:hypothetical protein